MFKTFMVTVEDELNVDELLNNEISLFLERNPNLKEVNRSAPSTSMTPVGSNNSGYLISIAVTSEFKETHPTAFK